jgi:polyhydroxybutyrate depolymerase
VRRALVALAVLLLLAACSDGKKPSAAPSASSSSPPPPALRASAGCHAPPQAPGETKVTLTSSGVERYYYQHVPPTYDGTTPTPVLIDLHGWQEGADIQKTTSQLGPYGDTHGFVTITPQGQGPVPHWNAAHGSDDGVFLTAALDQVEAVLCVDERRVFVDGYSNGAMFASILGCDLSDRLAAIATVDGLVSVPDCKLSRPVPVIAFHGTADPFITYTGGYGQATLNLPTPDGSTTLGKAGLTGGGVPPVPDVVAGWAALDGCAATPPGESAIATDVTLLTYACAKGDEVELYRIEGGGHTWPGSQFTASIASIVGPTTMSISADDLIWSFFQAHPMPT